ncbi:MAG: hypothetical protein U5K69_29445 [Balneolaceae bacterium]|nr:hypothetical protein [Balneolaceae bacterium]
MNFPSLLSRCFEPKPDFDQPSFTAQGGIPLNLEVLVRGLSDEFGDSFEWNEYLPAARHLYSTLRRIKQYWENHRSQEFDKRSLPYHNQSVWGFAMNDAWMVTEKISRELIKRERETYSIFSVLPEHAMYVTAGIVLNPGSKEQFSGNTQLDNARYLQKNGGIENLIVTTGHNNIIGAITDLKIIYSEENDLEEPPSERDYTVYRPEHFEKELRTLAEKVSSIGAKRVITPTIPYVTIPPVIRGINEDLSRDRGGYFDYYTRFWIWDSDFNPDKHPHFTKDQAIDLDMTVDSYNEIIRDVAKEYGWIVVPLNRYVSAIASRRLAGNIKLPFPKDFCKAMEQNPKTAHLVEDPDNPKLSTDFIRIDRETGKLYKGGIFSLDGIHPTTIGYGLMAHVYYQTMEEHGIEFQKPLDWDYIIEHDTLVTNPPYLLTELRQLLRFLSLGRNEKITMIGKSVLGQLMQLFSPRSRTSA